MTPLRKTVVRELVRTREQGRAIVVALEPGDLIGFRQKGRRTWYRLPLSAVLWQAVKAHATQAAAERRRPRRARCR